MKKLCVIFGGASSEHDISIITGMQCAKNLAQKYDIEKIYLTLAGRFLLARGVDELSKFSNKQKIDLPEVIISNNAVYKKGLFLKKLFGIDCVINCCHGGVGENGDLSAFFSVNGIRHTSSNPLASQISMNKSLAKTLLSNHVPTIKGEIVTKENKGEKIKFIKKNFSNNLIVKPNSLGSSIGVKACNKDEIEEQIEAIFLMHDNALVEERVIDLVEFNQACINTKDGLILSAIEQPLTKHEFLTFTDKYTNNQKGKDRAIPAKIPQELEEKINEYTRTIYKYLNLNGIVRIDYIFDKKTKKLYFNEVNTIPGSMAFYLFEPKGIDYINLIELAIENATEPEEFSYLETDILKDKII